jgi:hypothetical protein
MKMATLTCFYLAYSMSTVCYSNAPVPAIRPIPTPPAVAAPSFDVPAAALVIPSIGPLPHVFPDDNDGDE